MALQFTDAVSFSEPKRTRDGYLVVDARIARTGIQVYAGVEVDKPDMAQVRVYRPEGEVFDNRTLGSFAHKPVTVDHPTEMVSAANWKRHAVGYTGDTVTRDGDFVRVPFTIMDQAAIDGVAAGRRELSAGYLAKLDFTPGQTPQGEAYDAIMTSITGNHLAIVARGRAGAQCRIGDAWTTPTKNKEKPTMTGNLRTVLVDGLTIEVTDQGAQAIEKLTRKLTDAEAMHSAAVASLKSDHGRVLEAKDGEIAGLKAAHTAAIEAKDGEIAGLKAKVPSASDLDALIADRARVIDAAKPILGATFDAVGKTDADIRRAAVAKQLGDAAVRDRSDEYISACFDALTHDSIAQKRRPDPIRDHMIQADPKRVADANDAAAAHQEMLDRMSNGWRQNHKGNA